MAPLVRNCLVYRNHVEYCHIAVPAHLRVCIQLVQWQLAVWLLSGCVTSLREGHQTWHAGSAVRERLVFEDSLVGASHIINSEGIPEQACHASLVSTPDRLLLLASQGHLYMASCWQTHPVLLLLPAAPQLVNSLRKVDELCGCLKR